jgi:hypothetical protein
MNSKNKSLINRVEGDGKKIKGSKDLQRIKNALLLPPL